MKDFDDSALNLAALEGCPNVPMLVGRMPSHREWLRLPENPNRSIDFINGENGFCILTDWQANNLRALTDWFEANAIDERIKMVTYGGIAQCDYEKWECGTTACFAGHTLVAGVPVPAYHECFYHVCDKTLAPAYDQIVRLCYTAHSQVYDALFHPCLSSDKADIVTRARAVLDARDANGEVCNTALERIALIGSGDENE